jgi:hypothetical protein
VATFGAASLLGVGCGRFKGRPEPPTEAFVAPEWKSFKGVVFQPPQAANHPWRVITLQEWPRPKKTPHWRVVKREEAPELEMPERSRFRCIVNPVVYRVVEDEVPLKPQGWTLLRTVRCSSDGWRTYSQAAYSEFVGQDGTPGDRSGRQAELYLHDVIDGKGVEITMILRPD